VSLSITETENLIVSPVPASDGEFCVQDKRSWMMLRMSASISSSFSQSLVF
jgi:hypothetical protein